MGKAVKAASVWCCSVHVDQTIWLGNTRKRSQEDAVHHAKDRGVSANAKRQRDNCDSRKPGSLQQASNSVANVSQECFHDVISNCQLPIANFREPILVLRHFD